MIAPQKLTQLLQNPQALQIAPDAVLCKTCMVINELAPLPACKDCAIGLNCDNCAQPMFSDCDDCASQKITSFCKSCNLKKKQTHCPDCGHLNGKTDSVFQCVDCGWTLSTCPSCVDKYGGVTTQDYKNRYLYDHAHYTTPDAQCMACGSKNPLKQL